MADPHDDRNPDMAGFSMKDVWRAIRLYRWTAITVAAGTLAICVAVALFSTPVYRAEVQMMPVGEEAMGGGLGMLARQFGDLASFAGLGDMSGVDIKQEAMAILVARGFTVDFIREANLMPVLFPDAWGPGVVAAPDEETPTHADAYRLFDEKIRDLKDDSDSGIVTLGIEWRDPALASRWANELVDRINSRMRDRAIVESELSIKFLESEFERTSLIGVQQLISSSIETHVNRIALAKSRPDYAFKIVDPAVTPELDEFVRPRRLLLVAFGLVMGAFFAVAATLFRMLLARSHRSPVEA